jgi:hypothetical protein
MVAVFSKELSSWSGPFCISQQQDSLPQDATGLSVPVTPPIRPEVQLLAPIPFAAQVTIALQPKFQQTPEDSGSNPSSLRKRTPETGLSMSKTQAQACKYYLGAIKTRFTDLFWPADATIIPYPASDIDPHDDIAMNAIQTSLAILHVGSSLATKLAPIVDLLLQTLTMRDVRVTHISSDNTLMSGPLGNKEI